MRGEDNSRCPLDGWHALGLMSGTSVDGLDVASVRFNQDPQTLAWSFTMNAFTTLPYPEALRDQLWHAMTLGAEDLMRLDTAWAQWTAKEVEAWMKSVGCPNPMSWALMATPSFTVPTKGGPVKSDMGPCCTHSSASRW